MKPGYECDRCGACCCTFPVFAGEYDAVREPRIASEGCKVAEWEKTRDKTYQLQPLPFHKGCAFLSDNRLCVIYETRPAVCRRFAAGSPQCNEARARIGLPELQALSVSGPVTI